MNSILNKLINNYQWKEVLPIVEKELANSTELKNADQEKHFAALLHLRIAAKHFSGENDPIVMDTVRSYKYPSIYTPKIGGSDFIKLIFRNAFQIDCDAYVSNIPVINYFISYPETSATSEFVKRIGSEKILSQLNPQDKLAFGDYIIIKHKNLSAPVSYHIAMYDNDEINLKGLETGIINVLNHAVKNNLKKLSFFPIGFDALVKLKEQDKKEALGDEIANIIALTLIKFIYKNDKKNIPEILISFARLQTMLTFIRAFENWKNFDIKEIKEFEKRELHIQSFINRIGSKNTNYIKSLNKIANFINTDETILLTGETGSGKSYLAKIIHEESSRKDKPFLAMNCAAENVDLLITNLFGYKKGTHNLAKKDEWGILNNIDGGTLFLDEIGYTNTQFQQKLLTFIETKTYSRMGDSEKKHANIRFILGTNVDLEEAIFNGRFQHDFYERISGINIEIPPLRDRKEDIELLVKKILSEYNKEDYHEIEISDHAIELIKHHNWTGNIRQIASYLKLMRYECMYSNKSLITKEMVSNNTPRVIVNNINKDYASFETSLKNILINWDDTNFLKKLIYPTLAKIYLKDLKLPKKDAKKRLGIDAVGTRSLLQKSIDQYSYLLNKFRPSK